MSVGVDGTRFAPEVVNISVGDSVTWSWDSSYLKHNVDGDGFGSSGLPVLTGSFTAQFLSAGSFTYVCDVHAPGMAGTVNVS